MLLALKWSEIKEYSDLESPATGWQNQECISNIMIIIIFSTVDISTHFTQSRPNNLAKLD